MYAEGRNVVAPEGWGTGHNDKRQESRQVGLEPDLFMAANQAEQTVVSMLNGIVIDATAQSASDIHFEAHDSGTIIRFRLNGRLVDIKEVDNFAGRYIENKIREKAKMTINEKGVALDGRMSFRVEDRPIDMRVSVLPTRKGSSIVCRILDQSGANRRLSQVRMPDIVRQQFAEIMEKPDGLLLMTGPTGSGKTSTLYACLNEVNTRDRKILTIEDPVEYRLEGACQVEVHKTLTFEQALRASLRQDPDVILVGEIRDSETAKTALQAAMTGHLVFSTLHANSAATTLTRLTDLGVDAFTLGASLRGVVAQRLAPMLCNHCKTMKPLTPAERSYVESMGFDGDALYGAIGDSDNCSECRGLGEKGRTPVMEMIVRTDEIRAAIESGSVEEIEAAAKKQPQYQSLAQAALQLAQDGVISLVTAKFTGGA